MRLVEACVESHGGKFEHLLKVHYIGYGSQIKCFRTCVDMDFFLFWCAEIVPKICPHLSDTSCIALEGRITNEWLTRKDSQGSGIYL
jgi:hypothetical protein